MSDQKTNMLPAGSVEWWFEVSSGLLCSGRCLGCVVSLITNTDDVNNEQEECFALVKYKLYSIKWLVKFELAMLDDYINGLTFF